MRRSCLQPAMVLVLSLAPGVAVAPTLQGQSVLTRPPNLSAGWVGEPGVLNFNFQHRFEKFGDKIVNSPTFLLGVPLPHRLLLGVNYASNSLVTSGEVNEFELLARWAPVTVERGFPVNAALTVAYNDAAGSADGELSVSLPVVDRVELTGVVRVLSDAFGSGDTELGFGGGAVLRLHENLALAGDVFGFPDLDDDVETAFGVGLQTRIPLTPHTLSFQVTNTRTATLQGRSLGVERSGGDDQILYGFEFTIPITLSRYFGGLMGDGDEEGEAEVDAESPMAPASATADVEVTMTNRLRFSPETIRIRPGQTVRWRNDTPIIHTVTADPAKADDPGSVSLPSGADAFDSGDLRPGEVFQHTFRVPGTYTYFCIPHEGAGMVATVVVEG